MKPAFDRSSIIKTLKDGVKKGLWTIEDLDTPSPGWIMSSNVSGVTQFGNRSALTFDMLPKHLNLLRESEAKELTDLESMGTTKETEFIA